jgi:phosphatidylcholine synthase
LRTQNIIKMEEQTENTIEYSFGQKTAAWAVHAFTASGIVAGFWAIVSASEGHFSMAFAMLILTVIIDGVDGTFARICKVSEVLPHVSGQTMDYVIDFATYAIIPAFIIYQADLIPADLRIWAAALILIVSSLYYGKTGMVSNDMYFIGFPVMWNLVAFYLYYVSNLPLMGNFIMVVVFAILHFVPIKYLYPSRTKKFMKMNILASVTLLGSNLALVFILGDNPESSSMPQETMIARALSVGSLLYFGALSVYHTWFDSDTKDL